MIRPEKFYRKNELPTRKQTDSMWSTVETALSPGRPHPRRVDRFSFLVGIAAAAVAAFAFIGIMTTVRLIQAGAEPMTVKLDLAYRDAVNGFEQVALSGGPMEKPAGQRDKSAIRVEALQALDRAIAQVQRDTAPGDLSPLRHERLRQLYSQKLRLLETMIEEGDISL